MGVLKAARAAEHLAVGAARAEERLRQARNTSERLSQMEAARLAGGRGTVAVRQPQTVVVPREPINGAGLLGDVRTALDHMALWPSPAALVTATLFAAQAHGRDSNRMPIWQYAPQMLLTSEEGGSGKSWMGRLISQLCPDGETLIEPTKASLIQAISERKTITLDRSGHPAGLAHGIVAWSGSSTPCTSRTGTTHGCADGRLSVSPVRLGCPRRARQPDQSERRGSCGR